jgi:hypothetical protein
LGEKFMGVNKKRLIRGQVFCGCWEEVSSAVHIVDHDISYPNNTAPQAWVAVFWSGESGRVRTKV